MRLLHLEGKRILVRVDFNVPLDKDCNIRDDARIRAAIPTLKYLLSIKGVSVVIMSHLDRPLKKLLPDGTINNKRFSLKNILPRLSELLDCDILFAKDCVGPETERLVETLQAGQALLLENTRFHKGEEAGDEVFSEHLARLGQVYINDAFGTAHRAHASTCKVAKYFSKDNKAFGFLMKKELDNAKKLLVKPKRPYTAIIGGAKVSDKILLLEKMIDLVDNLIIGGGMAFTFIKAQGGNIGKSLYEEDRLENAIALLKKAEGKINLILPKDTVVADSFNNEANFKQVDSMNIPDEMMGLDIGTFATEEFRELILQSQSILWNGPMGVFEMPNFANGTLGVANAVAEATSHGAYSLIGGGDSAAAIHQMHLEDKVSFVSTGGGAMLELLEGKELPGVQAILD